MYNRILLFTALALSSECYSAQSLDKVFPERKRERLMVSDLGTGRLKQLSHLSPLSYATGHQFYDTCIELMDDQGHSIIYKDEYQPNQHYKLIKTGSLKVTAINLWFFSPQGVNFDLATPLLDQCTAENPCRELTQAAVDKIDSMRQAEPKLWLAPGQYQLPQNMQYNAQVLFLHDRMAVVGRSADFKRNAQADERAALYGTLSWNDYKKHAGIYGLAYNIRLMTEDNPLQLEDFEANLNMHSTGGLQIEHVDLLKKKGRHTHNIRAEYTAVSESKLSIEGESITNVEATTAYIFGSDLSCKGHNTQNLNISEGVLYIYASHLNTQADSCYSTAITAFEPMVLELGESQITMDIPNACQDYSPPATGLMVWGWSDYPTPVTLNDTEIGIQAMHAKAMAINARGYPLFLNNAKVKLQSEQGELYAIESKSVTFQGAGSVIDLNSSEHIALYLNAEAIQIDNESTPQSQCYINHIPTIC